MCYKDCLYRSQPFPELQLATLPYHPSLLETFLGHLGQLSLYLPGLSLKSVITDAYTTELAHVIPAPRKDCTPTVCQVLDQKQRHSWGQAIQNPSLTELLLHTIQLAAIGDLLRARPHTGRRYGGLPS